MAEHPPFAWHEKLEVLLLAAHLEAVDGWERVRISVPSSTVKRGGVVDQPFLPDGGCDWAVLVEAVHQRGGPYSAADLKHEVHRRDYERLARGPRPVWGPARLAAFLRSIHDAEFTRGGHDVHRDGIWHDDGRGFDLVAWKPATTLIVEAKGCGLDGPGASRAVEQALGKIVLNYRPGDGYQYGILVPGDEKSFLRVLRQPEARNPIIDELRLVIYSITREGTVDKWLRPGAERTLESASPSRQMARARAGE